MSVTHVPVGDGRTVAAEVTGEGPPVVLIHEGIADMRMWDDVLPALAERHRVVRYDLPGFGRSPLAGELVDPTRDLEAVLDAFDIERAALVGGSLGGRIALEFTARAATARVRPAAYRSGPARPRLLGSGAAGGRGGGGGLRARRLRGRGRRHGAGLGDRAAP